MSDSLDDMVDDFLLWLNDALESECYVTKADMWDCLASAGLTIVPDPAMDATIRYQGEIRKRKNDSST